MSQMRQCLIACAVHGLGRTYSGQRGRVLDRFHSMTFIHIKSCTSGLSDMVMVTMCERMQVRQLIKNHLSALAGRTNVFTGLLYSNDPTIMAWDVYNVRTLL